MKRRILYLAIGIGLVPWLWTGSYAAFRVAGSNGGFPPCCFIRLPEWAQPLAETYQPLIAVDQKLTGTRVLILPNSLIAQ